MRRLRSAAWAAGLGVLGAAAHAQPVPSSEVAAAAARQITLPGGVGGCVLRAMDAKVRDIVIRHYAGGARGVAPELPDAVAPVSARCTGRPYARSDSALVAAVLGAAERTGGAVFFAARYGIAQPRLDAVWREATPQEKAPFVDAAAAFLAPGPNGRAPTPADTEPFARRLQIQANGDAAALSPIQLYYLATAFSEAGEARLAAEGAKPAP